MIFMQMLEYRESDDDGNTYIGLVGYACFVTLFSMFEAKTYLH